MWEGQGRSELSQLQSSCSLTSHLGLAEDWECSGFIIQPRALLYVGWMQSWLLVGSQDSTLGMSTYVSPWQNGTS